MKKTELIKSQLIQLRLTAIHNELDQIISVAEIEKISYLEFVKILFSTETNHRMKKDKERRTKQARLPLAYNLDLYDFTDDNGLGKQQLNQLRELNWLEQNFNVILMGPSGTGKTYIAGGLCFDAVEKGYRAYFKSMEELINVLKLKDVTRTATNEYKRIMKAHLLVIDDIMMFPVSKNEAVTFFNFINEIYGRISLVITTNKSPKQWADVLEDKVLTTALLDRILHRCEIIKLIGESYRMKNRQTIFKQMKN